MAAVFALIAIPLIALIGSFTSVAIHDGSPAGFLSAAMLAGLGIGVFVGVLRIVQSGEQGSEPSGEHHA
ncbi:MAG: hypothetical protein NT062_32035 [Proteobacteria bacterium]|nr:hypothetical protein [Pseudomonadota bacterium]